MSKNGHAIPKRKVDELKESQITSWDDLVDKIEAYASPIGNFTPLNLVGIMEHITPIAFINALGIESQDDFWNPSNDGYPPIHYYKRSTTKKDSQDGWEQVIVFFGIDSNKVMHELIMDIDMFEYLDKAADAIHEKERQAREKRQEEARQKLSAENRAKQAEARVEADQVKEKPASGGFTRLFARG